MEFTKFLEIKFLEWQQKEGGRKTVKQFAAYIGVSQSAISTWWNGDREPEGENVAKLANRFGMEVYDALGLPRPDPDLLYIQQNWPNLDIATRRALREQAEKYESENAKNELERVHREKKHREAN